MMQFIQQFVREEEGQDVVEYALVLGLVAVAGIVALTAMGTSISDLVNGVTLLIPAA
jgi:pilus assembly protein Flp/PilA